MLRHLVRISLVALCLFATAALAPVRAATPEQAKAMADKAAALIASEGDKAFKQIDDPNGAFKQGELYVVVLDMKGTVVANGITKMIGMNMWDAKDPDGVPFTQNLIKLAKDSGSGWINYKFSNPATHKIQPKRAWIHKVGDYVVLCGVYTN